VAARLPPGRRLVAHGHRLSVAAIGPGATTGGALARAAEGLALDVALWDQLGCLSPLAVFVAEGDEKAADRVAEALAEALARAEERWPRGRVDDPALAAAARERADAELRAAAGRRVGVHAGSGWTVLREADASWRPAPLHRFVRVHPVADPDGLGPALAPLRRHLAGVAFAGFGDATARVSRRLAELGASLVCAPGTLQAPPLDWPQENRLPLLPLARLCEIEL
jgi:hypothetical protein